VFLPIIKKGKGNDRSAEQEKKEEQLQHDGKGDQLLDQIDQAQGFISFLDDLTCRK
jgi:hypothetical protein